MGGGAMRGRRWRVAPPRLEEESRLAAELGASPFLARLLINRGITEAERASAFLAARLAEHLRSPMLFRDMGRAAERLVTALGRGEGIGIYGDYDVDGISGSALLVCFFRALGADPALHVPHRLREGYGLNEIGVRRLAAAGARVMVTVDCGGVSHREIALAHSLGMDVVVCDHHQVSATPLGAHAVLNPIEADAGFPFSGLCGAGVAFYLALGVRMRLRESGGPVPDLRRHLDLVALGTIADLVPIVEENRVLVKYGLREISAGRRPGLAALKMVSGVRKLSSGAVGFRLAPRLNAGGRLADALRSVDLLTTEDQSRADQLAAALDEENRARQTIERQMLDQAVAMIEASGGAAERRSIVLASADWHPGVVGIVASRMVERYCRPTVLIAIDAEKNLGRGSARSIRDLDLYDALQTCRDCLEAFGGHRMAAGLSIRPDRVAILSERLEVAVAERTRPEDFVPVRDVDGEMALRDIDDGVLRDLDRLEPFGTGNPEPVFLSRDVRVLSSKVVGGSHLKLFLGQGGRRMPGIAFGMADRLPAEGEQLDILHSPMVGQWNGSSITELRVLDLRPHRPS
jgi:single-stranded-DNA-specific exonuclease